MNEIRARIFENLRGRTYPVNAWVAIHGVEDEGMSELGTMQRDGLVNISDAFGGRTVKVPMYRLTIEAHELVTGTVF